MKIFVNGQTRELSDSEILAIGIGTSPVVAAALFGLFKRAKLAEHKCEIWEKTASDLQAKIKNQEIAS